MKRIGVFFDEPHFDDYPFNIEMYRTVYRQLADEVRARGGRLCIVRSQETYLGKGNFAHAWVDDGQQFIKQQGPLQVDLIWNKDHFTTDETHRVLNDPELEILCTDKWECYKMFPDLHPKTVLVQSKEELDAALEKIPTAFATGKPLTLEGGKGVIIGPKEVVRESVDEFPYLIQAFVDTSGGIPGLIDEKHDFRILTIDGEIGLCTIRTTPPGEYTANVSRGGKEIDVAHEAIPPKALAIFRAVEEKMSRFTHRLYTVDMGRDVSGEWKLFELNAKPGVSPKETGPTFPAFYERLADFLLSVAG